MQNKLIIPLLVFILGIGLSFIGYFDAKRAQEANVRHLFLIASGNLANAIERELNVFVEQLNLVSSLFAIFPSVSKEEFHHFTKPILQKQKGIQAVEWAPLVPHEKRKSMEEQARLEWFPSYQFKEENEQKEMVRAKDRKEYYPVYYLEPISKNLMAVGFDLGSNPQRKESINKAKTTKKATLTKRLRLVQEEQEAYGVLLLLPVFAHETEEFKGLILGVMRIQDVIGQAVKEFYHQAINIEVFDKEDGQFLYFYNSEPGSEKEAIQSNLTKHQILEVGDRKWEIIYQATDNFIPLSITLQPYLILLSGVLLSGLLAWMILVMIEKAKQDHLRRVLEEKVKLRTHELNEAIVLLKRTQNRLIVQEKLASLGKLTGGIAHELKNPLNFINNFAKLTQMAFKGVETLIAKYLSTFSQIDSKEYIETMQLMNSNLESIHAQGSRADGIIQKMLEHSRTKEIEIPTLANINDLIDDAINVSSHYIQKMDSNLKIKFERNFDPSGGMVNVIASDLKRVFLNILNNAYYAVAMKAKEDDSFQPVITITTKVMGSAIEIRIKDNGKGIATEAQDQIFAPFYTTKPVGEGVGLGLSLSRSIIVDEHGGDLSFESKEGEYAEFIISLPIS